MTPKERAITALELRQPDIIPHFELEMQLTQEYFGKDFVSKAQWDSHPEKAAEFIEHNMRLLLQTGTKAEIIESCRYAIESGRPGGGYIFSTSNVIFKGMPRESYDLMLNYYHQHCCRS